MANNYCASERITGVANSEILGSGLASPEGESRTLKRIVLSVSARQGNLVRLWLEREKLFEIHDSLLQLDGDAFRLPLEVDRLIPVGLTVKAAISSGGTASNVGVMYLYEA